jgi:hypothetical protein
MNARLAVSALTVVGCSVAVAQQQPGITQNPVPVVVTNGAQAPVPVTSTALAAKESPAMFRTELGNSFSGPVTPTPPAGKVFVVTHISMIVASNDDTQPLTGASCSVLLSATSGGSTISKSIAAYKLEPLSGGVTWAANANTYFVLKPSENLAMFCGGSSFNVFKLATVSGYTTTP